ncbi:hypothetical protein CPB97_009149 [Podila verticillata]|nr:hypothetical protein CPB97_009149 [Podila verticillata]
MSRPRKTPIHSVLVLGSTQVGKSALIQHIKSYANPGYAMDETLLGNTIASKTDSIRSFAVRSNLPEYKVHNPGDPIDINNLATQYEDEDDYRDVLLTRPDKATLCEVPNASSKFLDFQFIDTPGLNGTDGRDSEHAANIVETMISTQSFNLIVFVISSKNPVTEEKQHTLEYYAFILRGLHSKIVFLYTHVDYSEMHHSNSTHHLNMTMRNKTLSTIFRRYAECDIEVYPSLSIDLVTKNRPVIQCLIRKTLRELLIMASISAAILDTSPENIKRIKVIEYPSVFNHEQRTKFEKQLQEGSQAPTSGQSIQEKPKNSILVLGKTQSGKSRLVQHIMNYVDPNHPIDMSLLGHGNVSKTDITQTFVVSSNLPAYEVYRRDSGEVINLEGLPDRYDNDEYHDILFSREKEVGLRIAPNDESTVYENVEFQFLDTPGLNDTNGRDSSHTANIISEMISTRSFSLIIIIVSFENPLTMEQRLALEYYANVFQGLHTRIMFLHTHVDYAEIHLSNTYHYHKLRDRNNDLENIFRLYATGTILNGHDGKGYPSLTIDLVSKKRPVINCLIRNTIREILKLATRSPVVFDASIPNIERIRSIAHPSKFNDEQFEKVLACYRAETQKHELPVVVHGEINFLLIGDVQSGKTSLIETFRQRANPSYIANLEHITLGNNRIADENVKITTFESDLRTIETRKLRKDGGYDVIDLDGEARRLTEEDFKALINLGPQEATTAIAPSHGYAKYNLNIYEGPSLNESDNNFERNIFNIHKFLVESGKKFHQVLFTLAFGSTTSALDSTIRTCSDIFTDLPLFSLVHTKVDYSMLHLGNSEFQNTTKKNLDLLRQLTQPTATFMIDCNLQSKWPVQRGKTYSVVRDILLAAAKQKPVALKSPLMRKTPRMVLNDERLKWEIRNTFKDVKNEISTSRNELSKLKHKINQLDIEYRAKDNKANSQRNKEDVVARDDMEVVYENQHTVSSDTPPETGSRIMACRNLPRPIEVVQMDYRNIEIENVRGGEGSNHWKIVYRRTPSAPASLLVKLYAKKLDRCGRPVGETMAMTAIRHRRTDLERKRDVVDLRLKDLEKAEEEHCLLRFCIFRDTLPQCVVGNLIKAMACYVQGPPVYRIKEIYLKSEPAFGSDPYAAQSEAANSVGDTSTDYFKRLTEGYSILMFGKTQAGKSTFIEFVKNYANQEYRIDESLIGTGVKSKTGRPAQFVIDTNLPSYEVLDGKKSVDITNMASEYKDADDYLDALSNRKVTVEPVKENPDTPLSRYVKITFLDTPGIEDTNGKDAENAPKIIHEMAKMQKFNLIVIIINSKDQPSIAHQLAFDYYSKVIQILQGCHDNIVFVYTQVDYEKCHPSNVEFNTNMDLRHKAFSRLFRGHKSGPGSFNRDEIQSEEVELYPMYTIDLNKKQRPIPRCMRLRKLRDILQRAVQAEAVSAKTIMKNLLRVYGLSHPDELNKMQRDRLLTPMRMVLEKQEGDVLASRPGEKKYGETKNVGCHAYTYSDPSDDDAANYNDYLKDCDLHHSQSSDDEV